MAKTVTIKLECDYCKSSENYPGDRQPNEEEQKGLQRWIAVQLGTGQVLTFDRPGCCANAMNVQPPPEGKIELVSA